MKKIRVAVTGNIGAGKSTFSNFLVSKGCTVIFTDDISIKLLRTDKSIKNKVIALFGNKSYSGRELNKKFIAEKVFSNPEKLDKLNSILHPHVLETIDSIIENEYREKKLIFIESALVYESNIANKFDYVVLITSEFGNRMNRSVAVGKFSEGDFKNRELNQISQSEKVKRADFIFTNDGSKEELFKKAELLLLTLQSGEK